MITLIKAKCHKTTGLNFAIQVLMPRRQDSINATSLRTLFAKHPYLGLFQKENWLDYLDLLARIYDLIEESGQQIPFEGVKILAYKFFREKELLSVESKVNQFIVMCIEELKVLKDFHDQNGRRMIELTRPGKQLLQLVEDWLTQRIKYSGTGAETLLAALNEALISQQGLDKESAIAHHKEKIRAYEEDLKRIKARGPGHAELLPVPHSFEALFSQAEGAAIDILAAVEDVRQAIENERKRLAQTFLESSLSSGQSVNVVAEFYEKLHQAQTYKSYTQAKGIFSFLEGYGHRYPHKDIPRILKQLEKDGRITPEDIMRSHLNGFQKQFEMADAAIQEKTRAQLQLLQLQVRYSLSTDVRGLQNCLKDVLQKAFKHKEQIADFFSQNSLQVEGRDLRLGSVKLHSFDHTPDVDHNLIEEPLEELETRQLIEALLRAEEATLKQVISRFKVCLAENGTLSLADYTFPYGLVEYYVLSEIELFDSEIEKSPLAPIDLTLKLKNGTIVIPNAPCYQYTYRSSNGSLPNY